MLEEDMPQQLAARIIYIYMSRDLEQQWLV